MRDAGGQSSPMAIIGSWRERERNNETHRVGTVSGWQSRALVKAKKTRRDGTMNDRFVIFVITLLGTRAAVDDTMKHKATSAETLESLIIASMLWFLAVVALDRLDLPRVPLPLFTLVLLQRPHQSQKTLTASVCWNRNKIVIALGSVQHARSSADVARPLLSLYDV